MPVVNALSIAAILKIAASVKMLVDILNSEEAQVVIASIRAALKKIWPKATEAQLDYGAQRIYASQAGVAFASPDDGDCPCTEEQLATLDAALDASA